MGQLNVDRGMRSLFLSKKYPATAYPPAGQRQCLERTIAFSGWSDEREARFRAEFADGKVAYVDRAPIDNLLAKDFPVVDVKDVAALMAKIPEGRMAQTDAQHGDLPIAFFPGTGWRTCTHEAVERIKQVQALTLSDDE
jgi:hypothetical protein